MAFYDELSEDKDLFGVYSGESGIVTRKQLLHQGDSYVARIPCRSVFLLITENSCDFLALYLGLLRHRIVVMLLNNDISKSRLVSVIESYDPEYMGVPVDRVDMIPPDAQVIFENEKYVIIRRLTETLTDAPDTNLALLLTTSGSTGKPKMARYSYDNIENNATLLAKTLNLSSEDRYLMSLSPAYSFGISVINYFLSAHAGIITTKSTVIDPNFWKLAEKYSVSYIGGVPYFYELLQKLHFEKLSLPSLRLATISGGKITSGLRDYLCSIRDSSKIDINIQYAQTETLAMTSGEWDEYLRYEDTVGRVLPEVELNLINTNVSGSNGQCGEIVCRSRSVFMGYASSREDFSLPDVNNGIWRTGDLACRNSNGYYFLRGRLNRFVKTYGYRISLEEIEASINSIGIETVCVGVDDHIVVYVTNSKHIDTVKRYILKHFTKYYRAIEIMYIENFPRNDVGKIMYHKLSASL